MKNNKQIVIGILTAILMSPAFADDNGIENTVLVNQLSLASAIQAAQVSISTCRKNGHQVSATVVDRYGQVQVVLRDTSASVISAELSKKKASTAANFRKNTTQLADLSDTAVGRSDGILMSAGGVLIKLDDIIYGAVGVSGSFGGATDDTCATAGADAIIEALKKDKEKASAEPKVEEGTAAKPKK